jgi:hypothetical protein
MDFSIFLLGIATFYLRSVLHLLSHYLLPGHMVMMKNPELAVVRKRRSQTCFATSSSKQSQSVSHNLLRKRRESTI